MISTALWQRSLDIFLLALFMLSHSFLKLHFEVLSENQSWNTKFCLRVRQAQKLMDFLYREEPRELKSWENLYFWLLLTLAGVAQWVGHHRANWNVTDLVPRQDTVRTRAWVVGQVPGQGCARSNSLMFLSCINVSLPLSLPPIPSP